MLPSAMHIDRLITRRLNAVARAHPALSHGVHYAARGGSWLAVGTLAFQGVHELRTRSSTRQAWIAPRTLLAVALVYAITFIVGRLVQRARPFADDEETLSTVPHAPYRSFPSRHVASACAMALVASKTHPLIARSYAAIAIVLGVSRVAEALHYPTDVLAGAALGIAVGRLVRDGSVSPRR
jgi:membrane-associated phospholipid phosphatase